MLDTSSLHESQSPQVGAMIRTIKALEAKGDIKKVSIPSSRGNDSDHTRKIKIKFSKSVSIPSSRGNDSDSVEYLERILVLKVSIPSSRGNDSDYSKRNHLLTPR